MRHKQIHQMNSSELTLQISQNTGLKEVLSSHLKWVEENIYCAATRDQYKNLSITIVSILGCTWAWQLKKL